MATSEPVALARTYARTEPAMDALSAAMTQCLQKITGVEDPSAVVVRTPQRKGAGVGAGRGRGAPSS
jgi:hypothetical protein